MSVVAKRRVMASPKDLSVFQTVAGLLQGPYIDASPIYGSYQIEITILGSYTAGDFDYYINYTFTKTWMRVPIISDFVSGAVITIPDDGISFFDDDLAKAAILSLGVSGSTEMFMGLEPSVVSETEPYLLYSPLHQAAVFVFGGFTVGNQLVGGAVIGTVTNNISMEVEDLVSDIDFLPPTFVYVGTPPTVRYTPNTFKSGGFSYSGGPSIAETDVSLWGSTEWRDFRGVYTNTETDGNGVDATVTITIA